MNFLDIKAAELAENEVILRVFGDVELENKWGKIRDSEFRSDALTWVVIKYLLANPGIEVDHEEVLELTFAGKQVNSPEGALRTRLCRSRALLKPLKLSQMNGLILASERKMFLNPDYTLISDEDAFNVLMGKLKSIPQDDPRGLEICAEALEIMRGIYMGYSADLDWAEALRTHYIKETFRLCRETLQRMKTLDDDSACGILWLRAVSIVPEEEEFHKELIHYLVERGKELDLLRYVSRLTRKGAKWLDDFEY